MPRFSLTLCLLLVGMICLLLHPVAKAVSYTWNGTTSTWALASNWLPSTGYPTDTDDVVIVYKPIAPELGQNRTVRTFTMSSGILHTGGNTLTITANAAFTQGQIMGGGEVLVTAAGYTNFGSPSNWMEIYAKVSVTSGDITLTNTTFGSSSQPREVSLTKTGGGYNYSRGNNTFYGTTYLKHLTGTLGNNRFLMAHIYGDRFYGDLHLVVDSPSPYGIEMGWNGNNVFSNIILDVPKGHASFGFAAGSCELPAGKSISINRFIGGTLTLNNFKQLGQTPQNLILNGVLGVGSVSSLRMGKGTSFEGDVTIKAYSIVLDGCTFNKSAYLNRTLWTGGTTNDPGFKCGLTSPQQTQVENLVTTHRTILPNPPPYSPTPGVLHNYFKGPTIIRCSNVGNGGPTITGNAKNVFSDELTLLSDVGAQIVQSGYGLGDVFQGNVYVYSTANAGIFIGSAGAATTLADQKTISVGNLTTIGYVAGGLTLYNFAQQGEREQTLLLTGGANLRIGSGSVFGGKVNFTAPSIFLDGAIYGKGGSFIKTGTDVAGSLGGNFFKGKVSMANQSAVSNIFNLATVNEDLIEAPAP